MSKIAMTFFCVCAMLLIGAANGKTSEKSEVVKITIRAGSWYLMVDENDEGQLGFGSNIQVPIKSGAFVFFDLLKKLEGSSFKRSEILNFTDRGNNNYAGVTFWKEGQVSAHADYVKNTEVVDIFDKALRNVIVFKTKEYHFDKALERNPPLGLKAERKISNEEELREYISNQNSLHASRNPENSGL